MDAQELADTRHVPSEVSLGGREPVRRLQSRRGEEGAILIFALIVMVVVALLLGALATFSSNDIKNAGNFQQERKVEYAGDGAVDAAIQAVRFSCYAFNSTTQTQDTCPSNGGDDCLPNGNVLVNPNANTQTMTFYATTASRRLTLKVYCVGRVEPDGRNTRVVTFLACSISANSCTKTTAIVAATVGFQDYGPRSTVQLTTPRPNTCSSPAETTTCGIGIVVQNWSVRGSVTSR